jgi:hypothetical protein
VKSVEAGVLAYERREAINKRKESEVLGGVRE